MTRALPGPATYVAYVACLAAAACSPPLMRLPTGAATAAVPAEAAAALAQITAACASVRTVTGELAVSGSAGGRRLRGRLLAGVAVPASVRLEAVAPFGQPLFFFVATGDDATLLLPRDERVLEHGRPDAVLEAVAGVPLGAGDLATTLTGCPPASSAALPEAGARQFGDTWLVIGRGSTDPTGSSANVDGDELFLRRETPGRPWQLVAVSRRAPGSSRRWRAEYTDRQSEIPRSIRVISVDQDGNTGRAFDLRLALSQVEINTTLGDAVFRLQIPATAVPITIEDLRAAGPLAPASNDP
jgi:hypothetical protein